MIPQGRLSSTPVLGEYLPPEGPKQRGVIDFEMGPIEQNDTSEGLIFQPWYILWDNLTGIFTAYPETGSPVEVLTVPDRVLYVSFTFDQNARINIAYTTEESSYLYWYDTSVSEFVTTNLGSDVLTPNIYLDDKRLTQNGNNDMLLIYTTYFGDIEGEESYGLWMRRQRDRFGFDTGDVTLLVSDLPNYYLSSIGMTDELRVQAGILTTDPELPTIPSAVPDPELPPEDPAPIHNWLDIAKNIYRTGRVDLAAFSETTFEAVFSQSVNGGDFSKTINEHNGKFINLTSTVDDMRMLINHSSACTDGYMFLCTTAGHVLDKIHYENSVSSAKRFINLDQAGGNPCVLIIVSDTSNSSISKNLIEDEVVPPPPVTPPPGPIDLTGATPWESFFGSPFGLGRSYYTTRFIYNNGRLSLWFRVPETTNPYTLYITSIGTTNNPQTRTGSINRTVGDFTSAPTQTWGIVPGLSGFINRPNDPLPVRTTRLTPGEIYIFNIKFDGGAPSYYLRLQATVSAPRP